ncbi:hypothetical protein H5V45_02080 [Nocardioides sp. KIGAM211]|uniref:Uncharacterized protein n=1 Tax=Nocardioides luti TaxID=2761101 RepID=A0A7X0V8X7_9ACTN|nr:hypothetical protein [Nocardioides luti]MBB6626099.1 hypothetical protein [Nocardioides luti]
MVVGLLALSSLTGCDDATSAESGPVQTADTAVDEMTAHGGQICPARLPRSATDDNSVGGGPVAPEAPRLGAPDAAWICRYEPHLGRRTPTDGRVVTFRATGDARPVEAERLPDFAAALAGLETADPDRSCFADLGPRWMLVYALDHDLTGVVMNEYGCGDVRLTDDPFDVAPGDATQPGTVAGILSAPEGFLAALKSAYADGA